MDMQIMLSKRYQKLINRYHVYPSCKMKKLFNIHKYPEFIPTSFEVVKYTEPLNQIVNAMYTIVSFFYDIKKTSKNSIFGIKFTLKMLDRLTKLVLV